MYSSIQRDAAFTQRLCAFIAAAYPIQPTDIIPAARGFYGETWRIDAPQGRFFAKLDCSPHQAVYERSFPVVERLCAHGIGFISKIVKTRDGALYARFEGGALGLFDWIDGENRQDEHTKPREYQMLAKVYTVDPAGLSLPREDFSARAADRFFGQWARVEDEAVLALLENKRAAIEHNARRLRHFSQICAGDDAGFAITHGDAGGNVIVNGEAYRIVDWDEPRLAPPERDAWFCLHWPWAMEAFHRALRQNGIDYALRPERLAYYCYHMYFFYWNSILEAAGALGDKLCGYARNNMDSWIDDNLAFAEKL